MGAVGHVWKRNNGKQYSCFTGNWLCPELGLGCGHALGFFLYLFTMAGELFATNELQWDNKNHLADFNLTCNLADSTLRSFLTLYNLQFPPEDLKCSNARTRDEN